MRSYIEKMPHMFEPRSVTLVAENITELQHIVVGLRAMPKVPTVLVGELENIMKEVRNG